jgi:hypothetical protein
LRRQRDLELDLGELVGRFADLAQEAQPARVGMDLVEQVLRHNLGEPGVVLLERLVEPGKRLVGLAAESVNISDVVGSILFVLGDQSGERGIGVGLASERVVGHRQTDHSPDVVRLLFDLGQRAASVALEQQRLAELSST